MQKKFFEILIAIVTPVIGVAIFTFVIKGPWSSHTLPALPIYQGLLAYFSLITLGFSYTKNRRNIIGIKFIPVIFAIIIFPILFYAGNGVDTKLIMAFVMLFFLVSSISFIKLSLKNSSGYLTYQLFVSACLPFSIVLDVEIIYIICLFLFFILVVSIYQNVKNFESYNYSVSGLEPIKSILIQAPLLILPFFDILIINVIGNSRYENYVIINKYTTGIFNLIFAYAQFKLLFGHTLFNFKLLSFGLVALGLSVVILSLYHDERLLFLLISILSLGVNISSLLIRNILLTGITIGFALVGPAAVALYYFSFIFLSAYIETNTGIFILLMFATISFPVCVRWFLRLY